MVSNLDSTVFMKVRACSVCGQKCEVDEKAGVCQACLQKMKMALADVVAAGSAVHRAD